MFIFLSPYDIYTATPHDILYCPAQMREATVLSQRWVSSSKIDMVWGHADKMWSAICVVAPYSQFDVGVRSPFAYRQKNSLSPIHRRLNLLTTMLETVAVLCHRCFDFFKGFQNLILNKSNIVI